MKTTRTETKAISSVLVLAVMVVVIAVVFVPVMLELAQGFKTLADTLNGALSTGKINP